MICVPYIDDKTGIHDELRSAYDLRNLRARKFGSARKQLDNSVVKLEPDVVEAFPGAAFVNEGLRYRIRVTKENSTARFPIGDVS